MPMRLGLARESVAARVLASEVSPDRVSVSRMVVVYEIQAQRAVRLAPIRAGRGSSRAAYSVREPVVLNVTNEQRIQLRRYEPAAIADALASMFGAAAVVVVYRATSVGESQLTGVVERRLRSGVLR